MIEGHSVETSSPCSVVEVTISSHGGSSSMIIYRNLSRVVPLVELPRLGHSRQFLVYAFRRCLCFFPRFVICCQRQLSTTFKRMTGQHKAFKHIRPNECAKTSNDRTKVMPDNTSNFL